MNELPLRTPAPPEDRLAMSTWPCGHPNLPWAVVDMANGSLGCPTCWEKRQDERGWVEGGHDVPKWWLVVAASLLVLVLAIVGLLMALPPSGANQEDRGGIGGGSRVVPAPYGPPDGNRHRIPNTGSRPSPAAGSLPLVGPTS
jgi:hypothetical protein